MTHTRRSMLKAAAAAGTILFFPSHLLEAADKEARPLGADGRPIRKSPIVPRSLLAGHVGSDFVTQTPGGTQVRLRLVEVEDLPNAEAANLQGSEEAFAARFEDSSGVLLSQGTYRLDHDYLGRFWFFLVPVGRPSVRAQTYEAIFNNAPVPSARVSPARKKRQAEAGTRPVS
jgi:hypothetical protein